ncbi:MAG: hypothetical protein IE909_07745, partial [Campylobacterales bacterium]|nr:hypothetical protein [Campylobacterales bacterium]
MSTKITDVELLITDYQEKLKLYADAPDANSSPSQIQRTVISLPNSATASPAGIGTSRMSAASDQVYVYIDGEKISVNYIETVATSDLTSLNYDGDATNGAPGGEDDILASRVATYQALADKISNKPGYNAYLADSNGKRIEGDLATLTKR